MKRGVLVLLLITLLGVVGCRKNRVIPDDTLADIFYEAFVVNAYIVEERIDTDSLQIYEPIFEKYGYTTKDVVYTVGNFSRRKSARLGTVVEQAISRLEKESKRYAKDVVVLDTISRVAVRTFSREVYADTLIRARKRADSTALHIEISPIYKGEYTITYNYKSDDNMELYPRTAEFYFEDRDGVRSGQTFTSLRSQGRVKKTLLSRSNSGRLVLELGKYNKPSRKVKGKKFPPAKQSLDITKLEVQYKPHEEDAVDSLFARYVDVKIFADGFLIKKDSLALSPDSTRVSTTTTRND